MTALLQQTVPNHLKVWNSNHRNSYYSRAWQILSVIQNFAVIYNKPHSSHFPRYRDPPKEFSNRGVPPLVCGVLLGSAPPGGSANRLFLFVTSRVRKWSRHTSLNCCPPTSAAWWVPFVCLCHSPICLWHSCIYLCYSPTCLHHSSPFFTS